MTYGADSRDSDARRHTNSLGAPIAFASTLKPSPLVVRDQPSVFEPASAFNVKSGRGRLPAIQLL
jgi:hypothetical protein